MEKIWKSLCSSRRGGHRRLSKLASVGTSNEVRLSQGLIILLGLLESAKHLNHRIVFDGSHRFWN